MTTSLSQELTQLYENLAQAPPFIWVLIALPLLPIGLGMAYITLIILAPVPRVSLKSERQYVAVDKDGERSDARPLPDWTVTRAEQIKKEADRKFGTTDVSPPPLDFIEPAEVLVSVVVPAYNEQDRIEVMLEEAVGVLRAEYSAPKTAAVNGGVGGAATQESLVNWEIVVVSDGSKDRTTDVVLDFARRNGLYDDSSSTDEHNTQSANGSVTRTRAGLAAGSAATQQGTLRVVELVHNRGKGGAVVHGMRHVRGQYVIFADADGASRFADIKKLIAGVERVKDPSGRAVGVGSRAHLVGSDQVVKRSLLRNTLMHCFHVFLRLMTPAATAAIGDTQCGFKLFTRPALPAIIPYMHSEGWIFDVEMLMLAEVAGVPMVEVPIGWQEVTGSKLNVVWDSLGMAYGLALLRAAWLVGVYRRD